MQFFTRRYNLHGKEGGTRRNSFYDLFQYRYNRLSRSIDPFLFPAKLWLLLNAHIGNYGVAEDDLESG
jgi:hypothetical protein